MELNIYHLYPEHLNLYGDLGNVNCLKRRCVERGIEVNVINFTDDESKFDLYLFIKMLSYHLMNEFCNTQAKELLYAYLELKELNKKIWLVNNKRQQFEHFISKYWKTFR